MLNRLSRKKTVINAWTIQLKQPRLYWRPAAGFINQMNEAVKEVIAAYGNTELVRRDYLSTALATTPLKKVVWAK